MQRSPSTRHVLAFPSSVKQGGPGRRETLDYCGPPRCRRRWCRAAAPHVGFTSDSWASARRRRRRAGEGVGGPARPVETARTRPQGAFRLMPPPRCRLWPLINEAPGQKWRPEPTCIMSSREPVTARWCSPARGVTRWEGASHRRRDGEPGCRHRRAPPTKCRRQRSSGFASAESFWCRRPSRFHRTSRCTRLSVLCSSPAGSYRGPRFQDDGEALAAARARCASQGLRHQSEG